MTCSAANKMNRLPFLGWRRHGASVPSKPPPSPRLASTYPPPSLSPPPQDERRRTRNRWSRRRPSNTDEDRPHWHIAHAVSTPQLNLLAPMVQDGTLPLITSLPGKARVFHTGTCASLGVCSQFRSQGADWTSFALWGYAARCACWVHHQRAAPALEGGTTVVRSCLL